jgi:hypothetical protein
VRDHLYPPRGCVGLQTTLEVYNPQLQSSTEERVEQKQTRGANWNRWVATDIHLNLFFEGIFATRCAIDRPHEEGSIQMVRGSESITR